MLSYFLITCSKLYKEVISALEASRRRFRENSSRVSALIILSIVLNGFLSSIVVLNPTAFSGNSNWLTAPLTEKVLICTAEGLQWIDPSTLLQKNAQQSAIASDKSSLNHNQYQHYQFHCPLLKHHQPAELLAYLGIFILFAMLIVVMLKRLSLCPFFCYEKMYLIYAPKQSPPSSLSL